MNTLAAIEAAAEALTHEQQEELFFFLAVRLGKQASSATSGSISPRRPNLHAGQWEVASDFDAPLSDEFWLGHDA